MESNESGRLLQSAGIPDDTSVRSVSADYTLNVDTHFRLMDPEEEIAA